MNRQRRIHDDFAVIDGLLPEEQFRIISMEVRSLPLQQTTPGKSIWDSIESENPKQSLTTFVWPSEPIAALLDDRARAALSASSSLALYPTNTPLDGALRAIKQEALNATQLLGVEGADWVGILASAFAYRAGTRASWHTDEHEYRGAFIYYVHPHWEVNWGGELLMEHSSDGVGDGAYLSPVPNRLVILKGGTRHSVARVSGLAGTASRTSIAGFFATQSFADTLLSPLPQATSVK